MIRVVCGCGRVFQADDRHSGNRTRCPVCGTSLLIGQTTASGSGEVELGELPSWWYPTDAPGTTGVGPSRGGGYADPEAVPTAVIEPAIDAGAGQPAETRDDPSRRETVPAGWGRTLVGGVAVMAALGVLCWIWWTVFGPGDRAPGGAIRADAVPRQASGRDGKVPAVVEARWQVQNPLAPEPGRTQRSNRRLRMLVPAYFYPSGDGLRQWRRLFDAAAKVDLVAVVNPSSGPGVEPDRDYAAIIVEAADRGVRLVGYIDTAYAERPVAEIKAEVDTWVRLYPRIAGFFLDQQPADARHATHVAEIASYARTKVQDAVIVGNPGVSCDPAYLARRTSDLVCSFSNSEGFGAFEIPVPLRAYEPTRHAALLYQVADAEAMRTALKEAIIKRIGWVYVTDGKQPNPWDHLPPYWEAEVEAVRLLQ